MSRHSDQANLVLHPFIQTRLSEYIGIKALTALMGRLSLIAGLESGPERGLKTVSFYPIPVI